MAQDEIVFSVSKSPEGGYEARALCHGIFTQADTIEQLREQVRDAVRCHFFGDKRPTRVTCLLVR